MENLKKAAAQIISEIGEDINRDGLKNTPDRVARSFKELTSGYGFTAMDVVKDGIFPSDTQGLVIQKNIEFYSLCEHHLLPFFGHVHIGYLPNNKIIGLSKMGRIVDVFSKRLQVQENLTFEIASAIQNILNPKGVSVVIEAFHFCMMMRGVSKQNSKTITSEYLGDFKDNQNIRFEFLQSIKTQSI